MRLTWILVDPDPKCINYLGNVMDSKSGFADFSILSAGFCSSDILQDCYFLHCTHIDIVIINLYKRSFLIK
jgi:hypothetical protein